MEMKKMNLKEMSINDLKALAYDQMAQIQVLQNNLNVINNEIAIRANAPEIKKQEGDVA